MRPNRLRPVVVALVVACVLGRAAGASETAARRPSSGDGTLAIASLAPQTGILQSLRDSLRVPVELAVTEINLAGGVNGAPVSFGIGDEGADLATARATLTDFADAGVDAVIGPASPATVLGVLGNVRKERLLMCSGSDTLAPVTAARVRRPVLPDRTGPAAPRTRVGQARALRRPPARRHLAPRRLLR